MNHKDYESYNNFVLTLCKLKITSEYIYDWCRPPNNYDTLVYSFVKTYKKPIDKYVPYWIENA